MLNELAARDVSFSNDGNPIFYSLTCERINGDSAKSIVSVLDARLSGAQLAEIAWGETEKSVE